MQIAFNEIGRRAILSDPDWNGGNYSASRRPVHGLAVARMVGHVTYLSEFAMTHKFGRQRQAEHGANGDEVRRSRSKVICSTRDKTSSNGSIPNSYLYLTRAIDQFDLFENGPAAEILRRVRSRFLVISFESDWLYPPAQSRELVRLLKRAGIPATYINIGTEYGHDSFLIENPAFAGVVRNYLENEHRLARN